MVNQKIFEKLVLSLLLITTYAATGQQIQLSGVIQDSIQNPLPNTNVIATPVVSNDTGSEFSIADQQGRYKLDLEQGVQYLLKVSLLGFARVTDTVELKTDTTRNFTLYQSVQDLEAVVIESEMAVVVNGDTTTYKTDHFKTGEERKLRDILKKLPGIEVDREGNVTVNGKPVNKLMVDGKDFFGGNTKLGVNNIPSDAVAEVEALDDYNEVAFMKGLADSDKMALNIKLKEGKKEFVFGETEAGGGIEDRYQFHPTLFYYSKETTLNFIGSLNNVGEAPLDYDDVSRFRGDYDNFLDDPIDSGDDGLDQFSNNRDIQFQKTIFGALNLTQEINNELRLTAYAIAERKKIRARRTRDITYLARDAVLENRENHVGDQQFNSVSKVKLRYKPSFKTDIAYDAILTAVNRDYSSRLTSQIADSTRLTQMQYNSHNVKLAQYFRYNSQPTYTHTWEFTGNYVYHNQANIRDWLFDQTVFPAIIPADDTGDRLNFLHDFSSTINRFKLNAKHFWVLNGTNHLYPEGGIYFFNQSYNTIDYQLLDNGVRNDFQEAGFNNALRYGLVDPYIGFQYKFKIDDLTLKPGLYYHHYFWQADQFDNQIVSKNKGVLLPEFYGVYKWTSSEKMELNYNLRSRFETASRFANRLRLVNFNQLYRGNEDLENSLYHEASLNYRKFSLFRGLSYFTNFTYTHREKSVRSITQLEGINQVSSVIYTDFPENAYRLSGSITKRLRGKYRLTFRAGANLSDYPRIINQERIQYTSESYNYGISGITSFKKWPNLTLGLDQGFTSSRSELNNNRFLSINPYAQLEYDFWNGFILNIDYRFNYYENLNLNQVNRFQIGDASLYYSSGGSPWGFELSAGNLFDVRFKNTNSFSEYIVYDTRIFIQPRTVLLKLSYQL